MSKLSPEKFKKRLWACKYCGKHIKNEGHNDWMMTGGNSRVCDSEECRTIQSIGDRPIDSFTRTNPIYWSGPKITLPKTREEAAVEDENKKKYQEIMERKRKKYGIKKSVAFPRNG